MPTSCASRCPEAGSDGSSWLPLALLALLAVYLFAKWWRSRHGMWIAAGHPLMREAQRKAQASIDVLRAERGASEQAALVKFRADTDGDVVELVWAELLALGPHDFTARVVTPPKFHRGPFEPTVTLPLDRLVDWQLLRVDGRIRGGFTAQVEIRLRRQAGKRLPSELAAMSGRFADG